MGICFYLLMLFLKHGKELESFIFCGIKAQIFEGKKDIVSVPQFTVFGCLAYNHYAFLNYAVYHQKLGSTVLKLCSIL